MWVCLFDDADVETRHELTELSLGIWHGAVPGVAPATRYGFRADGPWEPELGLRFNADKLLLDPFTRAISGRAGERPRDLRLRPGRPGRARYPRQCAVRPEGCRGARPRFRLGPRPAALHPLARHGGLRAARQGDDRPARPGAGAPARHVRRAGDASGHRLPARPRRDRGGAAAGAPVRDGAAGDGARQAELLGLQHDRVLRPAQRLRVGRRPGPAGARVQGDGQGLPRRRARGDPGRGLQPHCRGRDRRPDVVVPRARRPGFLPTRRPHAAGRPLQRHLLGRHRLRQHRRHLEPLRAAADPRLAAVLGPGDAGRRLPLRPDVGAGPRRVRRRHGQPPAHRDRSGPDAAPRQADRGAVGRVDGGLPGR